MGIFGYELHNNTPKLAQENLAAFRGYSCDTATKLLRCMLWYVEGGRIITRSVPQKKAECFAVLKQL